MYTGSSPKDGEFLGSLQGAKETAFANNSPSSWTRQPALEEAMPKNIVIYSDGTGQDGGVRPEQRVSNIYKMYRASRVSFDNDVDPAVQVTMYDAGLGTDLGATALTAPGRFVQKLLASVEGRG